MGEALGLRTEREGPPCGSEHLEYRNPPTSIPLRMMQRQNFGEPLSLSLRIKDSESRNRKLRSCDQLKKGAAALYRIVFFHLLDRLGGLSC